MRNQIQKLHWKDSIKKILKGYKIFKKFTQEKPLKDFFVNLYTKKAKKFLLFFPLIEKKFLYI